MEAKAVLLLDGGLGHELKRRGVGATSSSSKQQQHQATFLSGLFANLEDPEAVIGRHAFGNPKLVVGCRSTMPYLTLTPLLSPRLV